MDVLVGVVSCGSYGKVAQLAKVAIHPGNTVQVSDAVLVSVAEDPKIPTFLNANP